MKQAGIALNSILRADSELSSAVGSRIQNERVLQGTLLPYICIHTSVVPVVSDLVSNRTIVANCQINVYSESNDQAQTIAEYARLAMEINPMSTHGGISVQSVRFETQFSDTDDTAGEEGLFCEILTYQIFIGV